MRDLKEPGMEWVHVGICLILPGQIWGTDCSQCWLLLWRRGTFSGSLQLEGLYQMNDLSLYEEWGLEEWSGESQEWRLNFKSDMLAIREFFHSLPPVFVERTMMNCGRGSWIWHRFWSAQNNLEKLGAADGKCNTHKGTTYFDTQVFVASLSHSLSMKNSGNVILIFTTFLESVA